MMVELERALNRKVPLSVMLGGATIEHLADAIQQEAAELLATVVPIQSGDDRRPFFFLHGDYLSGGFYCARLAEHLGRDQPFYALPPCGLDGDPVPPSYAIMAKVHVEAMRAVQPEGPYLLGGLCNGGLVAYEVARLLEQEGQQVELLVLVAAIPANPQFDWLRRLRQLREKIGYLKTIPPSERMTYILATTKKILRRLRHLTARQERDTNQSRFPDASPLIALADRRSRLRNTYLRIDKEYDPGPYSGCVTLFWPAEDPISADEAAACWRHVAPKVNLLVIPGTHFTCLTVHARTAVEELRRCLKHGPVA
jgi:thioesterase domain-containing protein